MVNSRFAAQVAFSILVIFILFVYANFAALNGDEGPFLSIAALYAHGLHPVLDYFSGYTPSWFIPYSAFMALSESTHVEAGRFISVLFLVLNAAMAGCIAKRIYGPVAGWLAFIVILTNTQLLTSGISIRHQAVSEFGLIFACFILTTPRWPIGIRVALAAAGVALAGMSRLPLILGAIPLGYLILSHHFMAQPPNFRRTTGLLVIGICAGILGIALFAYPLILDPAATMFNMFGYRGQSYSGASLEVRAGLVPFMPSYIALFKFVTFSPLHIFVTLVFILGVAKELSAMRHRNVGIDLNQRSQSHTAKRLVILFALSIFVAYLIPSPTFPGYFQPSLNFMLIIFVGELAFFAHSKMTLVRWGASISFIAIISFQTLSLTAKSAYSALARDWGSARSVAANTKLACWLEEATIPKGENILSWSGTPQSIAGIAPPTGFARGVHIPYTTWGVVDEESAEKYGILTSKALRRLMDTEELFMIIDDSFVEHAERVAMPWYRSSLKANYTLVKSFAAMDIYVANKHLDSFAANQKLPATVLHDLAPREHIMKQIKDLDIDWYLAEISQIVERLGGSLMRIAGASYSSRCGDLLPYDQHVTRGSENKM